jgi:hypothetical protein
VFVEEMTLLGEKEDAICGEGRTGDGVVQAAGVDYEAAAEAVPAVG